MARSRLAIVKSTRRLRVLFAIVLVVFLLTVPIVGTVFLSTQKSQSWFVKINGSPIQVSTLIEVLRGNLIATEYAGMNFNKPSAVFETAASLTDDEVLRQVSRQLGISIAASDVEREIFELLFPDSTYSNHAVESALDERLRGYLSLRRWNENTLRDRIEAQLIRGIVSDDILVQLPARQPHVYLHSITVRGPREAMMVQQTFRTDVDFDEGASTLAVPSKLSDLGWRPLQVFSSAQSDHLWNLPPNVLSSPSEAENGSVVFYAVTGRDQAMPISEADKALITGHRVENWLNGVRSQQRIETKLDSDMIKRIIEELDHTRPVRTQSISG